MNGRHGPAGRNLDKRKEHKTKVFIDIIIMKEKRRDLGRIEP